MTRMTTGATIALAALLGGTARAAPAPQTMKFAMTTVADAQGMHMNIPAKVWVKGQKARLEIQEPVNGSTVMLVDGTKVRQLFPQRKQGFVRTVTPGKNGPRNPLEYILASVDQLTRGAKKLGQQNLDGYACDIYEKSRSEQGRSMTLKSWITRTTQPRLPLKIEATMQVKRPNMIVNQTQSTRITGLQIGVPIADSLFAVPAGYKIVEAGGPGGPAGPGGPPGVPGLPGAPAPRP